MLKFESQGSCPMVKMDFDITFTISKRSQKLYRLKDNVEIKSNVGYKVVIQRAKIDTSDSLG